MARIQIERGYLSEGDVAHNHLISNHLIDEKANLDKIVMYAEKRYLTTLLTSGARDSRFTAPGYTPSNRQSVSTKIKELDNNKKISSKGYMFKVMGRIQKEVEIVASSGVPTAATAFKGSVFSLILRDNTLGKGMVCRFPNNRQARIMTVPTRQGQNAYLYVFESYPGETYTYATWCTPVNGRRTIFGGHSSYGERSKRGYATFYYPDTYIQHTSIQRKSFSLSGDALAEEVVWYGVDGKKGFAFEAEIQVRTQFLLEDEDSKWFSKSTLKDAFGNLMDRPSMTEYDDGEEVWSGDGLEQQTRGVNDAETSGTNGAATMDDMVDMVTKLKSHMDTLGGEPIICITGAEGMANAQALAAQSAQTQNVTYMIDAKNNDMVGGMDIAVGYNFQRLNIAGEQILFVENPQWNDDRKFSSKLTDGSSRMGRTFFFGKWGMMNDGRKNVEIMARGRNGVDRNIVYLWKNGMTGAGKAEDPTDAMSFHMLKENLIIVYDNRLFGWLDPSATA